MSRPAPLLIATALVVTGVAACAPTSASEPTPASKPAGASDFDAAIARLDAQDPGSPQALNAHLQYADFLAGAGDGDCHARLDAAQAQRDAAAARPALRILLPLGQAKLDSTAYKIHAARAECDGAQRQGELEQALTAARAALGDYQDGLDYQSAAVMQFNIAATEQALGDKDAAIKALETTIAMDRDFGFRDDAQDNIRLLQHWQGGDESDAHVAALMKDFPARTAQFKFAWNQSDAEETIAATETNLTAGKLVQSTGTIALARHVRPDDESWVVSYDPANARLDMGDWPADRDVLKRFTAYMLVLALLETPKYEVRGNGDFYEAQDVHDFSTALLAKVATRLGPAPPDEDTNAGTSTALVKNFDTALEPAFIETSTAEQYSLQTATWVGAKLQQGVWYQMTAPMFLPGMGLGHFLVTHNIEFSYARDVPCTPQDAAQSCAEIVVHATPEPEDFKKVHMQVSSLLHMDDFDALHYWSSFNMRLVVRPDSLAPYLSDIRRSWYVGVAGAPQSDTVVSSERIVTTTAYH